MDLPSLEELAQCRRSQWQEHLGRWTFPVRIIELPDDFIEWYNGDGLNVGDEETEQVFDRAPIDEFSDYDEGWCDDDDPLVVRERVVRTRRGATNAGTDSDSSSHDSNASRSDEASVRSFAWLAPLRVRIDEAIAALGGSVLPKLNWSAPRDAVWLSATRSLQCSNASEVLLLLKASEHVSHDLNEALRLCRDAEAAARDQRLRRVELVLCEWRDVKVSNEFRVFVRRRQPIAISQRDTSSYFQHVVDERRSLRDTLVAFVRRRVQSSLFPLDAFCVDVYVDQNDRCRVIDVAPLAPTTDTLLFEWSELRDMEAASERADDVPIRLIETRDSVRPSLATAAGLPFDILSGNATSSAGGTEHTSMAELVAALERDAR